jgi:hypothetical protein
MSDSASALAILSRGAVADDVAEAVTNLILQREDAVQPSRENARRSVRAKPETMIAAVKEAIAGSRTGTMREARVRWSGCNAMLARLQECGITPAELVCLVHAAAGGTVPKLPIAAEKRSSKQKQQSVPEPLESPVPPTENTVRMSLAAPRTAGALMLSETTELAPRKHEGGRTVAALSW